MTLGLSEHYHPIGEVIIYGRLQNGTYSVITASKDANSLRAIHSIRYRSITWLREKKGDPILSFHVLNGLNEKGLVKILKRYRRKEADEINLGHITEEDIFAFENSLYEYYFRYLEAYKRDQGGKRDSEAEPISLEEQNAMVSSLDKFLREILNNKR